MLVEQIRHDTGEVLAVHALRREIADHTRGHRRPRTPHQQTGALPGDAVTAALEQTLQVPIACRPALLRLPADERQERHADAVSLEVECDPDPRSGAAVERLDGDVGVWSDRSVDTAGGPARGGGDLRYLLRHRPLGMADPARGGEPGAYARRATLLDAYGHDVVLPLGKPGGVGDVREDLGGRAADFNGGHDGRHRTASLSHRHVFVRH